MSGSKGPGDDPSMDDILACKIISDDEARGQAGSATSQASQPTEAGTAAASAAPDDVLLLTDLVDESAAGPSPSRPLAEPAPASAQSSVDRSLVDPLPPVSPCPR